MVLLYLLHLVLPSGLFLSDFDVPSCVISSTALFIPLLGSCILHIGLVPDALILHFSFWSVNHASLLEKKTGT